MTNKRFAWFRTQKRGQYRPGFFGVFFILHALVLTGQLPSFAQIGTWQPYVSYRLGQSVVVAGSKVYAASQNGLFYYDKASSETRTLSKVDGLSDIGISRLAYLTNQKRLLIAYRNGNLDFLSLTDSNEPGSVQNVNTIVTATNLPSSRTINHINRVGDYAYLSTDFGLVVLNLLKNEIRDTYFSQRTDGSALPIYQTTVTTDSLYALTAPLLSTETGRRLRAVRFAAAVNIADPANWAMIPAPALQLESIATNQNRLSVTVNGVGIYERQSSGWLLTQPMQNAIIRQFSASEALILATETGVTVAGSATYTGSLLVNPVEVVADGNQVWVADSQSGLLLGSAGSFQQILPEGPTQDSFLGLFAYSQNLVALPNGPQDATQRTTARPPFERLSVANGRWVGEAGNGPAIGFNSAVYLATEQKLYLSSYGGGLWSWADGQSLTPIMLPASVGPYISSLATDLDGNLWISTAGYNAQQATLHVRRADGQFQSFPAVGLITINQVVPDDNGFIWLRLSSGGILVFDPQTNRSRLLTSQTGQGGLLTNAVQAVAKDRNGAIWVGTDLGPTVFDNPAGAFDATIDAQPPILNRRRLLANEPVTAIAVDGGNRKWIGTRSGLYHVTSDGSQLLDTFTADNSPLPTNTIQALAIEPVSGKIFIETPNGLVAYQGPATEPAPVLSNLTIFPNPVRPDFSGTVGISGLTENSTVKIMDAGGQLVYETRSQGGTASWNLRDYRGRSAQTGIYLVVVVTADGLEGVAGKLAVVR
ncbi:two-component regulator propeller domain-containing protein [Spirosoma sp. SC4-14]|uniref:type IX secretion system anionic LPS delivery protein PorZ n=1 Tax=Spirosoma sp. SC4-14 TaxID=3128900 RepID=UPI0030CE5485